MKKRIIALAALLFLTVGCVPAFAQQVAVSTNIAQYLNFGTLNAEGSVSVARHWTATAAARYNPFSFRTHQADEKHINRKQMTFSAGARYWPWHVYSGWWAGSRLQYQQYNNGGLVSPETSEGERYGLALSGGYTYMLSDRVNVEFGAAFWGGWGWYVTYDCPVCGLTVDKGKKFFVLPDEAIISLVYLF